MLKPASSVFHVAFLLYRLDPFGKDLVAICSPVDSLQIEPVIPALPSGSLVGYKPGGYSWADSGRTRALAHL
jgi:hypothetical protein